MKEYIYADEADYNELIYKCENLCADLGWDVILNDGSVVNGDQILIYRDENGKYFIEI